jgi:chromosome partitioning protein
MALKTIAIANQKGGVGKTTTSINVAAGLAIQGHQVLLVDMDPQANATSGLGIDPRKIKASIYNSLIKKVDPGIILEKTSVSGLEILPANADLAGAEIELVEINHREHVLSAILKVVNQAYEYVILDCPPALGLLTINALVAASSVLIPVQCEYYAMEGLGRLLANIDRVKESFNSSLDLEGILLTMFDSRNSLAHQVSEEIRLHFKDKVYRTVIPRNVTLAEAPSFGRPVMFYNGASVGAQAYLALAKEIAGHGKTGTR